MMDLIFLWKHLPALLNTVFPQEPASPADFCERNFVLREEVAEFGNGISSVARIYAAFLCLLQVKI